MGIETDVNQHGQVIDHNRIQDLPMQLYITLQLYSQLKKDDKELWRKHQQLLHQHEELRRQHEEEHINH